MTSATTTVVGWGLIVAVGGAAYWQYNKNSERRLSTARSGAPSAGQSSQSAVKDRRKKEKGGRVGELQEGDSSSAMSGPDQAKLRKKSKNPKPSRGATSSAVDTTPYNKTTTTSRSQKEEGSDDVAFAQQLASAQSGTNLQKTERTAQRVRTNKVKAGGAGQGQDTFGDWQSSGPSSTAGEEPPLGASQDTDAPIAGQDLSGVGDMLEDSAPGPSSLRIVPSEQPQRVRTQPKAKPAQEEETKKQRQRRRKREAEKAQLAADEAERRKLMEKQLKTAREAEGTAKSGQYRTYTPPTNAWRDPNNKPTTTPSVAPVSNAGLLDTFEVDDDVPAMPAMPASRPAGPPSDESRPSFDSEPASSADGSTGADQSAPVIAEAVEVKRSGPHLDAWEDYQLRTITQREKDSDGWQEVPGKSKKKAVR